MVGVGGCIISLSYYWNDKWCNPFSKGADFLKSQRLSFLASQELFGGENPPTRTAALFSCGENPPTRTAALFSCGENPPTQTAVLFSCGENPPTRTAALSGW